MNTQTQLKIASLVGAAGVAAGAFGAHGLEGRIPEDLMEVYRTGALYHLLHAPVLLALALFQGASGSRPGRTAFLFLLFGVLVFSGSLYTLALSGIRWWGAVTPIGGTFLIIGWVLLFFVRPAAAEKSVKPA